MPNMLSREECLALAGRILSVRSFTPQELGFSSIVEYGTNRRDAKSVICVNEEHREIITAALMAFVR